MHLCLYTLPQQTEFVQSTKKIIHTVQIMPEITLKHQGMCQNVLISIIIQLHDVEVVS